MPLPVLRSVQTYLPADLVRLFHQSQLEWSRHLGEESELDFGRWISNPALPSSAEANCLLDAFLLPGVSGGAVMAEMEARSAGAWRACTLNPSMPADRTAGLAHALLAAGWLPGGFDILHRQQLVAPAISGLADLTVIPARASYRHYRQLMAERFDAGLGPSVEAAIMHLDDSHLDALLALGGGTPVGCIGVLRAGEVGTVREWYVSSAYRGQGVGSQLFSRAMEICARSVFKHVLMGLPGPPSAATRICSRFGFNAIGQWIVYRRP